MEIYSVNYMKVFCPLFVYYVQNIYLSGNKAIFGKAR